MTWRIQLCWPTLPFLAAATILSAQTRSAVAIISPMLRAQAENRIDFSPYIVTRDYKLFDRNGDVEFKSCVIAEIAVVPPNSKKYTIEEATGSTDYPSAALHAASSPALCRHSSQ